MDESLSPHQPWVKQVLHLKFAAHGGDYPLATEHRNDLK
jgi:hypothetical protein